MTAHPQYMELLDEFKEVHKELETFRTTGFSTAEIKKASGYSALAQPG